MGCKARFAANSTAIGKKGNAADRPRPRYHTPRGVMQSVPCAFAPVAARVQADWRSMIEKPMSRIGCSTVRPSTRSTM